MASKGVNKTYLAIATEVAEIILRRNPPPLQRRVRIGGERVVLGAFLHLRAEVRPGRIGEIESGRRTGAGTAVDRSALRFRPVLRSGEPETILGAENPGVGKRRSLVRRVEEMRVLGLEGGARRGRNGRGIWG